MFLRITIKIKMNKLIGKLNYHRWSMCAALMSFTRLPLPRSLVIPLENFKGAIAYYPLVGWLVGGVGFITYLLLRQLFPLYLVSALMLISMAIVSGIMHEDGFADFMDGFFGYNDREKTITIMQDSRLGTYGSYFLIMLLLIKFLAVYSILQSLSGHTWLILWFMLGVQASSRYLSLLTTYHLNPLIELDPKCVVFFPYHFNFAIGLILCVTGLVPWLFFGSYWLATPIILAIISVLCVRNLVRQRLGGYVGDCIGAAEQIAEVVILLAGLTLLRMHLI